jgi:hypothetical protein
MRISGHLPKATEIVERAVAASRAHGSSKREGIGLDLAASYARRRGDWAEASRRKGEADEAYRRWGAVQLADRPGRLGGTT